MRVAWLDYARAVAAFSVLSFHYLGDAHFDGAPIDFGPAHDIAQYGYLGVSLFFMISGFVISNSVEGKTAGEFVSGRLLRIYPTFVLCMTISALILLPAMWTGLWDGTAQYLANLTLFPGVFGQPLIDVVYWTLALEVEFYVAVAVLTLFRLSSRTAVWHPVWVAGIVLAVALHLDGTFPLFGGYFAFFASGAVIYDIRRHGVSLLRVGMLGVLAATAVAFSVQESSVLAAERHDSLNGWIVVAIVALFYLAFLALEAADARGWRPPAARLLGLMTYPLYLLHRRLGLYVFWLVGAAAPWPTYVATTALFSGLALLITCVIEPAMRPAWKSAIDRVVGLVLPRRPSGVVPYNAAADPRR